MQLKEGVSVEIIIPGERKKRKIHIFKILDNPHGKDMARSELVVFRYWYRFRWNFNICEYWRLAIYNNWEY